MDQEKRSGVSFIKQASKEKHAKNGGVCTSRKPVQGTFTVFPLGLTGNARASHVSVAAGERP